METYHLGAYWGVRPETAAECAGRALRFFEALKPLEPTWERWYRASKKPRDAIGHPAHVYDRKELEDLFCHGRNRARINREVDEELGFSIMVWTREREGNTRVEIGCGVYTPFSCNHCDVFLPIEGAATERLLSVSVLSQVLTCMAMAWDPDWGVVTSDELYDLVPRRNKKEPTMGWIMYYSDRQGRVPPLPAPVRMERVENKGTLITLTDERFTASNPEHVARAVRVHELLDRAGVLLPHQEASSNP